MEFPDLGKHCSHPTCNQLDFLPLKCDACNQIFCRDHITYKNHNCSSAYKKDVQVPVCPLCNTPIPVKRGEQPDIVVGAHIDNDCQSDPALNKRKVFSNKCSVKGCRVKEVVPVNCKECKQNFCLKHRLEADHRCEGRVAASRSRALDAALSRQGKVGGSGSGGSSGGASSSQPTARGAPVPVPGRSRVNASAIQGAMSEDEALARALALSMQDANHQNGPKETNDQVANDFILAQALAASEQRESTDRQSQSKCAVS